MLLFEMITWAVLGLVMAVSRFFFSADSPHRGFVFVGGVSAALLFGLLGRALSQAPSGDYAPLALLLAGFGALAFLMVDWLWTRRTPRFTA